MNKPCEYVLSANISLNQDTDELVLFNRASGAHYGLNRIGTDLVNAIQDNKPIARIVREIAERYQLDYPSVDSQVEQLVEQLLDQKLIRKTIRANNQNLSE